ASPLARRSSPRPSGSDISPCDWPSRQPLRSRAGRATPRDKNHAHPQLSKVGSDYRGRIVQTLNGSLQKTEEKAAPLTQGGGDVSKPHAVVIGSGFGGLAAAIRLGARGYR